eukprot:TRINITY_DN7818_c0_g1_i1.p1 TRINITY_DN7818_c0_g1~~TRINITY_DN7818_c0_g1_i1.p1  ORF type:complete len:188 (+),score=24.57 TRINITY_DN7818_c0_g1_i1:60-623(+)
MVPGLVGQVTMMSVSDKQTGKGRGLKHLDSTRAGVPTVLHRTRQREGNVFVPPARPTSAPPTTLRCSSDSLLFSTEVKGVYHHYLSDMVITHISLSYSVCLERTRRPHQVKMVPPPVPRRDPLLQNDVTFGKTSKLPKSPHRSGQWNKQSEREFWDRKPLSKPAAARLREKPVAEQGAVPGEEPPLS